MIRRLLDLDHCDSVVKPLGFELGEYPAACRLSMSPEAGSPYRAVAAAALLPT